MHISYSFEGQVLVLCADPGRNATTLEAVIRTALADPRLPVLRGTVYDVRDSNAFSRRTIQEVEDAAYTLKGFAGHLGRIALIASTDVAYGLMRVIRGRAATNSIDIEVFRTQPEAVAWLGQGPVETCRSIAAHCSEVTASA